MKSIYIKRGPTKKKEKGKGKKGVETHIVKEGVIQCMKLSFYKGTLGYEYHTWIYM